MLFPDSTALMKYHFLLLFIIVYLFFSVKLLLTLQSPTHMLPLPLNLQSLTCKNSPLPHDTFVPWAPVWHCVMLPCVLAYKSVSFAQVSHSLSTHCVVGTGILRVAWDEGKNHHGV